MPTGYRQVLLAVPGRYRKLHLPGMLLQPHPPRHPTYWAYIGRAPASCLTPSSHTIDSARKCSCLHDRRVLPTGKVGREPPISDGRAAWSTQKTQGSLQQLKESAHQTYSGVHSDISNH